MNFLLASIYFFAGIFSLNLQAQILDFEGFILCGHKGGNGIITADLGAKSLNFENILSRSEFEQAKAGFGYKLGELPPTFSASAFRPILEEGQSLKQIELFAENLPFGGPLVKASASLIIKDFSVLESAPNGSRIPGELRIWMGEMSSYRKSLESGRLEPQFKLKGEFSKTLSCEISR